MTTLQYPDRTDAGTDDSIGVVDPASGEVVARVGVVSAAQLEDVMSAAAGAFTQWRLDEAQRRTGLRAIAATLRAATDELAALITTEQGKPLPSARGEVERTATWFSYFAELELPYSVLRDDASAFVHVTTRPLGVVAAITPWNYPLMLASWKLAPALLAGNTVVLKPSPFTPLATARMGELLAEVLPPGVLQVVVGGDDLGRRLTTHPLTSKISFTGSTEGGRSVALAAAAGLKRVTLELGGNDPALVLPDIDLDTHAVRLFWSAFWNNGQVCSAVKRVYAPRERYDEVVAALSAVAESLRVGPGTSADTQLGPVSTAPQIERVTDLVERAVHDGARAATGGHRIGDGGGYFYAPTILAGARDGMSVVDEEQFGPVLPVVAYDRLEDVVTQVNSSTYGLGASVWGADTGRAEQIGGQLDCGTVWINHHLLVEPNQPFGGARSSGMGTEGGQWGLAAFTEPQTHYRARD